MIPYSPSPSPSAIQVLFQEHGTPSTHTPIQAEDKGHVCAIGGVGGEGEELQGCGVHTLDDVTLQLGIGGVEE